jgi:hypothetical protein
VTPSQLRAIFHEEDDADAVANRLVRDGFEAIVVRERLAGEDDEEDHPWAVLTDAPEFVLDILVEKHEGWVDVHGDLPPVDVPPAPIDLPTEPRRIKGHFGTE